MCLSLNLTVSLHGLRERHITHLPLQCHFLIEHLRRVCQGIGTDFSERTGSFTDQGIE